MYDVHTLLNRFYDEEVPPRPERRPRRGSRNSFEMRRHWARHRVLDSRSRQQIRPNLTPSPAQVASEG